VRLNFSFRYYQSKIDWEEHTVKRYQLSIPGPTECDPEVLNELNRPNIPHYGDLWLDYYLKTLKKLQKIYQTNNSVYIIPSSGSGAIDATFASLAAKKGLILNNGTFGERLSVISSHYLSEITVLQKSPGECFEIKEIEAYLEKDKYDLLAVVHGETSTGMLNHLEDLSQLCQKENILFIVDAVSTLGGVDLSVDRLGIDFCISASQKALGSIPGLSTVSISPKGWKGISSEKDIPGWYFNLRTWQRYEKEWGDWHPFPMTLPVHLFYALNKAFDIILKEGLEQRWARHKKVANILCTSLEESGISLLVKNKECLLPTVTSAVLPGAMTSEDLQKYMKEEYGILIAGGVGPLRKRVFRVGHMAYSAQEHLVKRVISGIRSFLSNH
jgi:alanine-glyoxylate transaminase / serine-glyoxylate transaminase / serine-pyruvate transaminase